MSEILQAWVGGVAARARWVLLGILVLTVASGFYAAERIRINSDLNALIDQTSDWRVHFDDFEAAFPDWVKTAVVVVHGESFDAVEQVALDIEARLRADPSFRAVSAPQNDPFLRDHALLYMGLDDLDDMADRLAEAQPVLTAVAEDPSLPVILKLVVDSVVEGEKVDGLDKVVSLLTQSARQRLAGGSGDVAWADEFFTSTGAHTRVISLKGSEEFSATLSSAEVLAELAKHLTAARSAEGVEVLVTGELALTHEEIDAALTGVEIAGWLSLAFLIVVMAVGVRSVKIAIATIALLVCGVVITTAWAMFAVGEFNTLSLVFIVMFFGLGVDFALHFSLRYQEAVNADSPPPAALRTASRSVGNAIAICTVTTAIGFLGFWPTAYRGLADLGVISAGGMFVAAFLTFTLLPALYAQMGEIRHHQIDLPTGDRLVRWLTGHRAWVVTVLCVLSIAAAAVASRSYFDYSVLALRDESAPSMQALRLLQREGVATDYALYVVHGAEEDWAQQAEALAVVDSVILPSDLVPKDQDDKLFVLQDLQQLLWSALEPQRQGQPLEGQALRAAVRAQAEILLEHGDPAVAELAGLLNEITALGEEQTATWQTSVVTGAQRELAWLRRAVAVNPVSFEDLPEALTERVRNADGRYLSVLLPSGEVKSTAALAEFVTSVREVVPQATGRPVIEWGVGAIVQSSFVQALLTAAIGIFALLTIVFRSFKDALLIMLPLSLAALFTLAFGVFVDQPINMASVLVIPLIFGLGVDNGIHVFDRYRRTGDVSTLLHSSTPRAVVLSTLTTVGAFASLMLSPHAGTASIGALLTVAIGLLLIFTVFLLPVLLHKS